MFSSTNKTSNIYFGRSASYVPGTVISAYTKPLPPWVTAATQLVDPGFGTYATLGDSVATNLDGTVITAGASNYNYSQGAVVVWRYSSGSWGSPVTLPDPGFGFYVNLGQTVAINSNGTVVTAGAPYYNSETGAVVVWTYSGGTWGLPVTLPDPGFGDGRLGSGVAINSDGTVVTAGAYTLNRYTGVVVVWTYSGGSWGSPVTLLDPGLGQFTYLGSPVAINSNGTVVTAGASGYNSDQGAIVMWTYSGGTWGSPVTLPDPGLGGGSGLGNGVAINSNGTVVTAGALYYNSYSYQGAVVVWRYSGGTWGTPVILPDPGLGTGTFLGNSVAINSDGTVVTAGAFSADTVVVWTYSSGSWGSPVTLPDPGLGGSHLGISVSINSAGTRVTAGANQYATRQGTVVVWNK